MPLGSWWMKQNSQWLSQVRTRSKTAEETSTPSGSPGVLATTRTAREPRAGAPDDELEVVGSSTSRLVLDDVAGRAPVERDELVAGRRPARSAGDAPATATLGADVTRAPTWPRLTRCHGSRAPAVPALDAR